MRWLARLALTMAILVVGAASGPELSLVAPRGAALADAKPDRSARSESARSGKSDKASRSDKTAKQDKASKPGKSAKPDKAAKPGKSAKASSRRDAAATSRRDESARAGSSRRDDASPARARSERKSTEAADRPARSDKRAKSSSTKRDKRRSNSRARASGFAQDPSLAEVDEGAPSVPAPSPTEPAPSQPVVDSPTPAPSEPDAPVVVDGPIPTPSRPETPAVADPVTPEPDAPVVVDNPTPAPADPTPAPDGPVVVDNPRPTPTPTPSRPEAPVVVDNPRPTPVEPTPTRPATPVVDTPTPSPTPSDSDGDVAARPDTPRRAEPQSEKTRATGLSGQRRESDAERRNTGLQSLIDRVVRGAPAAAPTVAATPEPTTRVAPAPALAVAPAVAPEVEPAAKPERAARAKAQPAHAARAPRIALSSGGDGSASYRQYEITALGLTPHSRQVIGALGFRILSERKSPLLGNQVVARLRTPSNQTAEAALRRVRAVLPELTFDLAHLYRPSGEAVAVRYPAEMVGAPEVGSCRIDARIGLIDSGVGAHPTLARADIVRRNFVGAKAATNVAHGTAIASILVGDLPGSGPLVPGAKIFSANVFARDAAGLRADASAIIEALDWLAAERVPVVNLSLMGPSNELLAQAVDAATRRGLILVAAAGNDGPAADPAFPAAYPAVIAVSAVDARGRPYGRNNRGSYVYIAAPGVDIWGADARGGEAFWTGTSFAAPFVTATVARDITQGRARDINDGRARLAAGARDLGAPGRDPIYGYGLLQFGGCTGSGGAVLSSKN